MGMGVYPVLRACVVVLVWLPRALDGFFYAVPPTLKFCGLGFAKPGGPGRGSRELASAVGDMSYRDLQAECKKHGLKAAGSKVALQERLEVHLGGGGGGAETVTEGEMAGASQDSAPSAQLDDSDLDALLQMPLGEEADTRISSNDLVPTRSAAPVRDSGGWDDAPGFDKSFADELQSILGLGSALDMSAPDQSQDESLDQFWAELEDQGFDKQPETTGQSDAARKQARTGASNAVGSVGQGAPRRDGEPRWERDRGARPPRTPRSPPGRQKDDRDDDFFMMPTSPEDEARAASALLELEYSMAEDSRRQEFQRVYKTYCRWLRGVSAAPNSVDDEGKKLVVETVLRSCQRGGLVAQAKAVLRDMSQTLNVVPSAKDCNMILSTLTHSGKSDSAVQLLRDMEAQYGVAPDLASYTTVIYGLAQDDRGIDAVELYDHMVQVTGIPAEDLGLLRTIATVSIKAEDWNRMFAALDTIRSVASAFHPWDVRFVYTTVMAHLNGVRRPSLISKVFEHMDTTGIDPDGLSYGLAISAAARQTKSRFRQKQAITLLREAHELRDELDPPVDHRAYQAVAVASYYTGFARSAFTAVRLAIEADSVSQMMVERTIASAGKNRMLKEVNQLLDDLRNAGFEPSPEVYSALIEAHEVDGSLHQVPRILDDMVMNGVPTDAVTYNVALRACARKKDWDLARETVQTMRDQKLAITPASFQAMFEACAKRRESAVALEFLGYMDDQDMEPTAPALEEVLRACMEDTSALIRALEEARGALQVPQGLTLRMAIDRLGAQVGEIEHTKEAARAARVLKFFEDYLPVQDEEEEEEEGSIHAGLDLGGGVGSGTSSE